MADLPAPAAGLPAPAAGLPTAKARSANLAFGEIDLPLLSPEPPVLSAQLPSARAPSPAPAGPGKSLPPFSLGSEPPAEVSDDDLLEGSFPPASPAPAPSACQRAAGGGISFGELDLGGGDDLGEALLGEAPARHEFDSGTSARRSRAKWPPVPAGSRTENPIPVPLAEDDMEFGGIPQAADTGAADSPGSPRFRAPREPSRKKPRPRRPSRKSRRVPARWWRRCSRSPRSAARRSKC